MLLCKVTKPSSLAFVPARIALFGLILSECSRDIQLAFVISLLRLLRVTFCPSDHQNSVDIIRLMRRAEQWTVVTMMLSKMR